MFSFRNKGVFEWANQRLEKGLQTCAQNLQGSQTGFEALSYTEQQAPKTLEPAQVTDVITSQFWIVRVHR